jgi:RNA-directed DNA polymerase
MSLDLEKFLISRNVLLKTHDSGEDCIHLIMVNNQLLLLHSDKEILNLCQDFITKWKLNNGFNVILQNFAVVIQNNNFEFLGFNLLNSFKSNSYKYKLFPSKKSQVKLLKVLKQIISKSKGASAYNIIKKLVPILIQWANYFAISDCKLIFRKLDYLILEKLRTWVFRHHALHKNRNYFKNKYFPATIRWVYKENIYKDNWTLYDFNISSTGKIYEANMIKMSWTKQLSLRSITNFL